MNITQRILGSLFIVALCISPASAVASDTDRSVKEPLKQCADLLKECFASAGLEKSNCLFSTSKHPFCEGTSLGTLTYQRWLMSPVRPAGPDAPGLLGPQLIDQKCLTNFDNRLLSQLISEEYTTEKVERFKSDLSACTSDISNSLTRP